MVQEKLAGISRMKTELLHSYSSTSLSGLSKSPSSSSLNNLHSNSQSGLVGPNKYSKNNEENGGVKEVFKEWGRSVCRKKVLHKKLPFLAWGPKYNLNKAIADIIAGLTVGLTILPQGLAYATLSGLPPQYGLYSGFVGCFVYIFLGSTESITIGPTASMAIITLSYSSGKPPAYTVLLTFLTGVVTLIMGFFQLGFIVNFISTPVMSGFTSAVAITIISTQIKSLLGLQFPANGIIDVIKGLADKGNETKLHDTILSIICIFSLLFLQHLETIFKCAKKLSPFLGKFLWLLSVSRSAIVVIICTLVYSLWGERVSVVGDIVPGLPSFKVPQFSFSGNNTDEVYEEYSLGKIVSENISALLVIPILAIMEHITIAKAVAGNSRVDATQEMLTIGLSNLIGAFCNSMPVTGAFSRTMVNHASGVESPMGGLVTGVLVLLALQFLTPYFYYIPNAALAAVIVCAVVFTIDFMILKRIWRSKKMDIVPWGVTFLLSLLLGLEFGILGGFLISLLFILYYAARPSVRVKRGETSTGIEFILVDLDRSLTFPSVEYTRYVVLKSSVNFARNTLPVVVDCTHIQFADFTAASGMKDIFTMFNEKNQMLILWRLKPSVVRIVTGVMEATNTPFRHCSDEKELEKILESQREKVEKLTPDVRIVFTMAGDGEDNSEYSSDEVENNNVVEKL